MRAIKSRGAGLIIAMILLLIVTLLATTGMMMSTAEMVMAGNEQFHRQAADAASGGVEAALARLSSMPMDRDSSLTLADATASGEYIANARFAGEASSVPGFSAGRFSAVHFEIESTGQAARHAGDEQFQGVMVIRSRGAVATFVRRGGGLDGGVAGP
jgi:Tfp pilus assembly protein PilX